MSGYRLNREIIADLRNENSPWPRTDPLYMGLRREAAEAIERLEKQVEDLRSGRVKPVPF